MEKMVEEHVLEGVIKTFMGYISGCKKVSAQ
jgi:hypothetical protein